MIFTTLKMRLLSQMIFIATKLIMCFIMASVICCRMDFVEMAIGRFNMIGVMPLI